MEQVFSTEVKEVFEMLPFGVNNRDENKLVALVVDDCGVQRQSHKVILEHCDVKVYVAENGKEAIEICRSGITFDLILMDREMPIMDGLEATRVLRDMGIRSKIIGVSARSKEADKLSFMEAGLDDFYEKPLRSAVAKSLIKKVKETI